MIITPGHLFHRADFYHQLSQLTAAGIGVTKALEQIQHHPPGHSFRRPLKAALDELAQGKTFSDSLRNTDWFPEFDLTLIEAGERSGRLDSCFRVLADYYTERGNLARQIITQMMYPAFLLHFAAFIFMIVLPFAASQFNASIPGLFVITVLKLLPVYAVIIFLVYANQSKHGEKWRAFLEKVLAPVPVLGSARRSLALSRLAIALEALISAGVNIVEAWRFAAAASNSPALRRTVEKWSESLASGATPAELVNASRYFPQTFANLYHSGEVSGQVDETLKRLHTFYQEDSSHKIRLFIRTVCFGVYLLVVLVIAFKIIGFYTGYFNQVSGAIKGF